MSNWVRVTFYGRLPLGQAIQEVDLVEAAERLGEVFGFDAIDGLSAVTVRDVRLEKCEHGYYRSGGACPHGCREVGI